MAGISHDENKYRRIQFVHPLSRERKAIRLGRVSKKAAEGFQHRVERLIESMAMRVPIDAETAAWVAGISDEYHARIAAVGLADPRVSKVRIETLKQLIDAFEKSQDVKESTATRAEQATSSLTKFFGDCLVSRIDKGGAERWRADLRERYAQATVARTVVYAQSLFKFAIDREAIEANPFSHLKKGPMSNPGRASFVTRAMIDRVIAAAPDAEWRLIIALARYGALRVPSELFALRWTDVDFDHGRIVVRASKTAHHEDGGERVMPLFPEIRPYLEEVRDLAPEGSDFVIERNRSTGNLRTRFCKIIRRAGIEKPWQKLFQNLRASRCTELSHEYPSHVREAWCGHSDEIARKHYLQTTSADWQRALAAPKSAQASPDTAGHGAPRTASEPPKPANQAAETPNKWAVRASAESRLRERFRYGQTNSGSISGSDLQFPSLACFRRPDPHDPARLARRRRNRAFARLAIEGEVR